MTDKKRQEMMARRDYNNEFYKTPKGEKFLEKLDKHLAERRSWTKEQYFNFLYNKYKDDKNAISDIDFNYAEKDDLTINDLIELEDVLAFFS